jgi:hypothetical protein
VLVLSLNILLATNHHHIDHRAKACVVDQQKEWLVSRKLMAGFFCFLAQGRINPTL